MCPERRRGGDDNEEVGNVLVLALGTTHSRLEKTRA
jgi:hypothetical protein